MYCGLVSCLAMPNSDGQYPTSIVVTKSPWGSIKCQKIRSSRNKVVEIRAERNVFAQLVLLSMEHDIDLELALSFQLGPVPWALATADGSPVKSDKSKLLHNLEGTIVPSDQPAIQDSVYICDGNAILQAMT